MASIQRETIKKDGTITFTICVSNGTGADGERIRKTITYKAKSKARTKARNEAEKYAFEYETRVQNGDLVEDEKITFSEFIAIWEKNWLVAKTPTVKQNYRNVLRIRVEPYIGNMRLTSIKATHIDKIIKREVEVENKAPDTVRMTFAVINSVFRYALKKKYITENPCARCDDLPSAATRTGNDIRFWGKEQVKRFLNDALVRKYPIKIKNHKRTLKKTGETYSVPEYTAEHSVSLQWRAYFNLAIFSSMRRGEQCALTWEDIDLEKGMVSINKAFADVKEGKVLKSPKTESSIRDLSIPVFCTKLLQKLKMEEQTRALEMGSAWKGHTNSEGDSFDKNYVFVADDGQPVSLSTPGHKFHEIVDMYNSNCEKEAYKLPVIRLHDLRHTGATLLLSENTDIETVSRRLGHSKASVTLDIYGHALPENDRKAAETLESMLI